MVDLPIPVSPRAGGENRDYATIFADLKRLIPLYTPEWTYLGDDDQGIVIAQLFAYLVDHAHYRADTVQRDATLSRSVWRHIVKERAEWLGYLAQRPSPATVDVTFTLAAVQVADVIIPAATRIAAAPSSGTVYFETTDETIIPAGDLAVTVSAVEGATQAAVVVGYAAGSAFERFVLGDTGAIFNYGVADLTVTVDDETATWVRWPIDATPTELTYWARERRDRTVELRFGDGTYGRLLPAGAAVRVAYRRGGGTRGRVRAGAIDQLIGSIYLNDVEVELTVTNATRAIGGEPEETIDSIRRSAPAFFATQDRAVTLDDYAQVALGVVGVYRAKAIVAGINGVIVYVVPDGAQEGAVLTAALKAAIVAAVDAKKMCTDVASVAQADLIPIDIELECRAHTNARRSALRTAVRQVFVNEGGGDGFLDFESNELAQRLNMSDAVRLIENVPGMNYVDVYKFTRRPLLNWKSRIGDAALSADGVTVTIRSQEQVWTVRFLDESTYTVTGSVSGLQVNQGTIDVPYEDDASEIGLTIESGDVAMGEGDWGEISVGKLVWNVQLGANEFPVAGVLTVRVTGGIE